MVIWRPTVVQIEERRALIRFSSRDLCLDMMQPVPHGYSSPKPACTCRGPTPGPIARKPTTKQNQNNRTSHRFLNHPNPECVCCDPFLPAALCEYRATCGKLPLMAAVGTPVVHPADAPSVSTRRWTVHPSTTLAVGPGKPYCYSNTSTTSTTTTPMILPMLCSYSSTTQSTHWDVVPIHGI